MRGIYSLSPRLMEARLAIKVSSLEAYGVKFACKKALAIFV